MARKARSDGGRATTARPRDTAQARGESAPRARRRALLRACAPVVVLCAVAGGKLLAMSGAAHVARTALVVGNVDDATRAADSLAVANVVERWKAPFAAGTARAAAATDLADLAEAEAALRTALGLAVGTEECAVRYNLALVVEAQGDAAASDPARAEALFREAQAVADAAPQECADEPPLASRPDEAPADAGEQPQDDADGGDAGEQGADEQGADEQGDGEGADGGSAGSAADDLAQVSQRQAGKADAAAAQAAAQAAQAADTPGDPAPPSADSTGERKATLSSRQDEAQRRERAEQEEREVGEGDGVPDVPAPW